jgi:hypothetical protein
VTASGTSTGNTAGQSRPFVRHPVRRARCTFPHRQDNRDTFPPPPDPSGAALSVYDGPSPEIGDATLRNKLE